MGLIRSILVGTETPYAPTSPPPPPPPPPAAPNAPTALALSSRTDTTWTGSYTDNSSDEDEFRIKADGSQKGTAAADATSITASGLTEGTEYDFVVVAYNAAGGESSDSNTVTSYTKLAAPSGLSAVLSGGVVTFTFTINSSNYSEHQMQKDSVDEGSPLALGVNQYQVAEGDAAGTWRVYARGSGKPDSEFSGTVSGPPWPE